MKRDQYEKRLQHLIPPAFDLDRYQDACKLDSLGWYTNLLRRQVAKEIVDQLPVEENARLVHLGALLSILGRRHLCDESFFGLLSQVEKERMIEFGMVGTSETLEDSRDQLYFRGFRSLTLGDIMGIRGVLRQRPEVDELVSRHNSVWDIAKYEHDSNERNVLSELFVTPFDMFKGFVVEKPVHQAHVSIDLEMPDKILIESFKTWLKCARIVLSVDWQENAESSRRMKLERSESKDRMTREEAILAGKPLKAFSESQHFRNWGHQQILPYLDLCLCNHLKGQKPTASELQDIVFPGNQKTERAFYKGTVKPVNWLFKEGGMAVLRVQAEAEHSLYVQAVLRREFG